MDTRNNNRVSWIPDMNIVINYIYIFLLLKRVNFINDNEILTAHRQLEANQAPQIGHFCTS